MNMILTKSQIGLDGVPAAETVLSHVDGERGELIIAGEHVANLADKSSFEGVTARLWNGATGSNLSEANVRASLGAARERAFVDQIRKARRARIFLVVVEVNIMIVDVREIGWVERELA